MISTQSKFLIRSLVLGSFLSPCFLSSLAFAQTSIKLPDVGVADIKELQTLPADGAAISQQVREMSVTVPQGTTWIPLGRFKYGTLHRLEITGGFGHSSNSSAVVEFSSSYSGVAYAHRLDQFNWQNRFKIYAYKVGVWSGIAIKYINGRPETNTIRVKHTGVAGGWLDHEPAATFFDNFTDNNLLKASIKKHSGSSYVADGLVPGIYLDQKLYANKGADFKGAVTVSGSPMVTQLNAPFLLSSKFASRGGVANGAYLEFGANSLADGLNAVAIGKSTQAKGESATSLGSESKALASYSFAAGRKTQAKSSYAAVFGYNTTAGYGGFAAGYNSDAAGSYSVAMGYNADTKSSYAAALGYQTQAAYGSFAAGMYSQALPYYSVALGRYNSNLREDGATAGLHSNTALDPIFSIGNGTSTSNRKNALTVYRNGNTKVQNDLSVQNNLTVNGTITVEPQGDVPMGIFGGN